MHLVASSCHTTVRGMHRHGRRRQQATAGTSMYPAMKDDTFMRDPGQTMAGASTGFSTLQSSTTVSADGTNQRDDQG